MKPDVLLCFNGPKLGLCTAHRPRGYRYHQLGPEWIPVWRWTWWAWVRDLLGGTG